MSGDPPRGIPERPAPDDGPPADTPSPFAATPAGGPQTEDHADDAGAEERPAGTEHAAGDASGPVRQGIMAALKLFAAAVALELVTLLLVRLSGNPDENVASAFLMVGLFIFVVGLFVALTISPRLPPAARLPFWAMGVVCSFMTMVLWGVTCGLAGTPRF